MKNLAFVFALVIATLGVSSIANARPAAIPEVDSYQEGNQRLQFVALPDTTTGGVSVTLVYEDGDSRSYTSVTVDPKLVATKHAATFQAFLAEIDPSFLSFVKASLADRLLHLRIEPRTIDRAESTMFFPSADLDVAFVRNLNEHPELRRAE